MILFPQRFAEIPKSHPRQWVVHSVPFTRKLILRLRNPTNGSWWIVQKLSKMGFEVSAHCRGWDYK